MPSLWSLLSSLWFPELSSSLSGECRKRPDLRHMTSLSFKRVSRVSCRLIHCTWVYPVDHYPPFFGYYFFNVMLMVLQLLHIYWAFLISRMLYKFIFSTVCVSKRLCLCRFDGVRAFLPFTVSLPAHLYSAAGRGWQEWPRGGRRQRPTQWQKTKSHEWLRGPRPGQRPLTPADSRGNFIQTTCWNLEDFMKQPNVN